MGSTHLIATHNDQLIASGYTEYRHLFGSTSYYWCNTLYGCMGILDIFQSVDANYSSTTCIWAPILQSQPLFPPAPPPEPPHLPPRLWWVTAGPLLICCRASTWRPPNCCRASARPPSNLQRWVLAAVPVLLTCSCFLGLHVYAHAAANLAFWPSHLALAANGFHIHVSGYTECRFCCRWLPTCKCNQWQCFMRIKAYSMQLFIQVTSQEQYFPQKTPKTSFKQCINLNLNETHISLKICMIEPYFFLFFLCVKYTGADATVALPLPNQHEYTKGLGTETAVSSFADLGESAFHRGDQSLVVSLDCSGAFNRIIFSSVKEALDAAGVPAMSAGWYNKVLSTGHLVSADLQGAHNTIIQTMGSPQGGILSPLVWNLVMNSLLSNFPREGVKAIGYTDDVILIFNVDDPTTMASLIERVLRRVGEWGDYNGLTFNSNKTTTVMFHRGRKRDYFPNLYMGGRQLQYSDKMTYLGIAFSKTLSWTDHIKSQVRKCTYWRVSKADWLYFYRIYSYRERARGRARSSVSTSPLVGGRKTARKCKDDRRGSQKE